MRVTQEIEPTRLFRAGSVTSKGAWVHMSGASECTIFLRQGEADQLASFFEKLFTQIIWAAAEEERQKGES